jgi:hypothetical protein
LPKDGITCDEKENDDTDCIDDPLWGSIKWMPTKTGSRYYCPIGWIHGFVFGDGDYDKLTDTCNAYFCGDSVEMNKLFSLGNKNSMGSSMVTICARRV